MALIGAVAFEAGHDGFWLARWLAVQGVEAHVIHASSVAVTREHRRAKTDRRTGAPRRSCWRTPTWSNVSTRLDLIVDAPRQIKGEAGAFTNADMLFKCMRDLPINTVSDSLSALSLVYRVSDFAAQFDNARYIQRMRRYLGHLRSVIRGDEAIAMWNRMSNEYASLQRHLYSYEKRCKYARDAANGFRQIPAYPGYFSQEFGILYYGWQSTIFNFVQVAMSSATNEIALRALRDYYDKKLVKLGDYSSMSDDAANLRASDPYRAQLIGAQLSILTDRADRGSRFKKAERRRAR